eukprot:COSAG02_NODE_16863_length_1050_cov_0.967403_1_plen_37_part_10
MQQVSCTLIAAESADNEVLDDVAEQMQNSEVVASALS